MITSKVDRLLNGGIQKVYVFPNGYGASVVKHNASYGGGKGLWELAVITCADVEKPLDFELTYTTPITDDVIGWLHWGDVEEILERIEKLEVQLDENKH